MINKTIVGKKHQMTQAPTMTVFVDVKTSCLTINTGVHYLQRLRFILNHLLLVSFSLKFCDHVESVYSWVLAGIVRVMSNKHVVREQSSPPGDIRTSLQVLF